MNIKHLLNKLINRFLNFFGFEIRRKHPDFYLHEYSSYEEYNLNP